MSRYVEVSHEEFIAAPTSKVRAQFADLNHHIAANVHPKLRFEVLSQSERRARFVQEVRLLGIRQRDVFERDAFAREVVDGALRMHQEEVAQVIGELAVVLLRHEWIEAPQPGLHMRERNPRLGGSEGPRQGRVDIARDHHCRGPSIQQEALDSDEGLRRLLTVGARTDIEKGVGLRKS